MVLPLLKYLRRYVIECTTECLFHSSLAVSRPTEITQLQYFVAYHYVLRLDVPVSDVIPMQILHSPQYLDQRLPYKLLLGLSVLHQLSPINILHQQKDMIGILEVGVKLDDVWVVETVMDLQLLRKLIHHVILFDSGLEYFLQGVQSSSLFMFALQNIPELPRT